MIVSGEFTNGIRFEGTKERLFVSRGNERITASDPGILTSSIGPNEIHLYESTDHHGNWLDCVRTRKQPIAPVDEARRTSCHEVFKSE